MAGTFFSVNDGKVRTPRRSAGADALRLLARRPLTLREIRERLKRLGHAEAEIGSTIEKLTDAGYLDDSALALNFILARAQRKCQGRSRLIRELEQRGVTTSAAEQAWVRAVDSGDLDPEEVLARAVRRQLELHGVELDVRRYRRVYNALLRAGFDPGRIIAKLKSHRLEDYPGSSPAADE